jgi:hypothetical protein
MVIISYLKLDVNGSEIHLNGALDLSNFELCFLS